MSLTQTYRLPDGRRALMNNEIVHVIEDIQKGDGTLGWSGDPSLFVCWNAQTGKYEVWREGSDGSRHFILARHPARFNRLVLVELAQGDLWSNPGLMDDIEAQNTKWFEDKAKQKQEIMEELDELWRYILKKHGGVDEN